MDFGFLQMFATLSFAWLASVGHDNTVLAITVGLEFFAAGLGTTAFVAFIARATNPKYTATQFALFSSLASVPRTFTNASTGYFVDFFRLVLFLYILFFTRNTRHVFTTKSCALEKITYL